MSYTIAEERIFIESDLPNFEDLHLFKIKPNRRPDMFKDVFGCPLHKDMQEVTDKYIKHESLLLTFLFRY